MGGYELIKLLIKNKRKTKTVLITYCETYYKAKIINEAEYLELTAMIEEEYNE